MGKCVELSVCLNSGRKNVYFYLTYNKRLRNYIKRLKLVFFFKLPWSEVYFLLLDISTFEMSDVWRKHLAD